jgi:hypothetical protein
MTCENALASRCCAYRAFGRSHGAHEFFERMMLLYARRALHTATNVDCVGHHRRDRSINIPCVQTTGENQESRVAHRSPRSGPIARLTGPASELGVVRIDEYIAIWERCCGFWLEVRIGRERANHAKFSSEFAARFGRRMSMQLDAPKAGNLGELANFCWLRIDENADGADFGR